MVLVPMDTPGVDVERQPTVFGYQDRGGHPQIHYDDVTVPVDNLLGEQGGGFAIAQARLGPGRIHQCMRAIGAAERCLDLMIQRSQARHVFGGPLSDQGVIREWIADARIRIEQTRLLVLKTAWMIDSVGARSARVEIAAIKVAAPALLTEVADRAIQLFGAAGFTEDFPLARFYSMGRWLQIADGPDEVHRRSVARAELGRLDPGAVPDPYLFG
jgi:acyl-CoA dehydrogenase